MSLAELLIMAAVISSACWLAHDAERQPRRNRCVCSHPRLFHLSAGCARRRECGCSYYEEEEAES